MKFTQSTETKLIFVFLIILITFSSKSFSQQLFSEPAGGMNSEELYEAILTPVDEINYLPDIFTYSHVASYYDTWDTMYVRRYAQTYPKVDSILFLPIFNIYSKNYTIPVQGEFLSPFGYRGRSLHAGVDIRLNHGDPVKVAFDGVVRVSRYLNGYGNCVVVRHFNGLETLYAHLSKLEVSVNQPVRSGDIIGLGGSTGRSTCNHLHFETRFQGKPFNPRQIFDFSGDTIIHDTILITDITFNKSKDYLPNYIKSSYSADKMLEDYYLVQNVVNTKSIDRVRPKYHKIKKGENLSLISRKYNVPIAKICQLNNIKKNSVLRVGKSLKIK